MLMLIVGSIVTMLRFPEISLARWLHRWLVEAPAARLSRLPPAQLIFLVIVAGVLVAGVVGVNAAGLLSIQPLQAFQSPYWDKLPVDEAPLLAALRQQGVTRVWMNHWAGQPLMFDARTAGPGICTASTPPGARNDSRRGNSVSCPSTQCSAALE